MIRRRRSRWGTPPREPRAPRRLGEHTDALLREVPGLGAPEIEALRASGAVSLSGLGRQAR